MAGDLVLAIDFGTQSVRALAFDRHGRLAGRGSVALDGYSHPRPGWMEHDVAGLWQALGDACAALWAEGAVTPERIAALVVTTQRATVINLDANGQPLRPAIIWPDQRRAQGQPRLPRRTRLLFRLLWVEGAIRGLAAEAEANWIAENQPEVAAATSRYLLLSGYLNQRLTGRCADAVGAQVGFIPFDYRQQRWAAPGSWSWGVLGLSPDQLPELVPGGAAIGPLAAEAAAELGLPAGLPVIAGASDKACEVLGSGVLSPEVGAISCGTTATINVATPHYFEAFPGAPAYPGATPGMFNTEVQVASGFWLVRWFTEQFGQPERQRALAEGQAPESYFDALLASTPPGADGLMLQPLWNPGVRPPGPGARGSVIGFAEGHTRAHLYRAIIEGLAYALREGRERIEARGKVPLARLRVAGGGARSDAVMQIIADVLELPAERPAELEASGLGAAILAAVGLGWHPDIPTAVAAMTGVAQTFTPDPERAAAYRRRYRAVYARLYPRLAPLYAALRLIR
ncbi:MAG: FGGY-family carbohydrate kinase [Proteobacteria bacterium]|nr:FGGY-family carbohydrate kinase [Pseudomonadota bacterium]